MKEKEKFGIRKLFLNKENCINRKPKKREQKYKRAGKIRKSYKMRRWIESFGRIEMFFVVEF
jgi:hypothetical protein